MSFRIVLLAAWPLFAGLVFIMTGNGLQGTLLGLRASMEAFDTKSIGIIMSMYYVGFLAGSISVPNFVKNVGHIRVFAALTALASTTVLVHGVFLSPVLWTIARAITGFSFAGLYVVIESWINSLTNRKTRGRILAIYMLVQFSALAAGQMCLYIAPPESITPFILASVLVSIAAIPVSLSRRPAPSHAISGKLSIKELWKVSPLSFYSVGISGFCGGVFYTLAPVYGAGMGMSTNAVANFMALFLIGGIFGQLPVGTLSDRIGRRKTIIGMTFITATMGGLSFILSGNIITTNILLFAYGASSLTTYSLGAALAMDNLNPEQYVSASSSLLIVNGACAVMGPLIVSMLMGIHIQLFFPALAIAFMSVSVFGLYRSTQSEAVPMEEQGSYTPTPSPVAATQVATQMAAQVVGHEEAKAEKIKKTS